MSCIICMERDGRQICLCKTAPMCSVCQTKAMRTMQSYMHGRCPTCRAVLTNVKRNDDTILLKLHVSHLILGCTVLVLVYVALFLIQALLLFCLLLLLTTIVDRLLYVLDVKVRCDADDYYIFYKNTVILTMV